MGYDIVITKAASNIDTEEHPIAWSEWMAVVNADSDVATVVNRLV